MVNTQDKEFKKLSKADKIKKLESINTAVDNRLNDIQILTTILNNHKTKVDSELAKL